MKKNVLIAILASVTLAPCVALAQTTVDAPLCTDRPTKANAPCTVPVGEWQLETDVANTTHDRQGGVTTDTLYPLNPYLKYGLSDHTDIEVNWAPSVLTRTRDDARSHTRSGHGDLVVRFKARVVATDTVTASLIPFVKAPVATRGFGNDRWEGGLAMPIGVTLPAGFTVTFGPELDALADADGHGRHLAITNLVNLSHPLTSRLGVAVELWQQNQRDPGGHVTQRSADIAMTFAVTPLFQLDAGANIGLNAHTPDQQFYLGLSHRW